MERSARDGRVREACYPLIRRRFTERSFEIQIQKSLLFGLEFLVFFFEKSRGSVHPGAEMARQVRASRAGCRGRSSAR